MEEEKKEEQVTNTEITNANAEQIQNNELKEQQESKNTKTVKGKGLKAYIIVIIIIALAITYGCGFILGKKLYEKNNNSKTTNNSNDNKTNKKINNDIKSEISDNNVISRLENFVKIASYNDSNENGEALLFMNGVSNIENKVKLKLTWNSLVNIKKVQRKIGDNIPEKYKDVLGMSEKEEITISQFENEYKYLFNEEPNYRENDDFASCPGIYKIDKELGKIYIGIECGGFNPLEYYYKIYKYEEDNSFYYVYQYVAVNDPLNNMLAKVKSKETTNITSFEGNEDKFETVIWKFDKNFNFISTENVGVVSK